MHILTTRRTRPDPAVIKQALAVLMAGGVVAYPTDTAYGLAVDATNEEAIGKLFIMKHRPQKPLPVLVSGVRMAASYADIPTAAKTFLKKYWPGAVTFILPSKKILPIALTLHFTGVGLRHADQPVAQALVRGLDKPITSTSANISGKGVFYSGQEVARHFEQQPMQPDLVIDVGDIPEEPPSTIVDLTSSPPSVLRQGSVKVTLQGKAKK